MMTNTTITDPDELKQVGQAEKSLEDWAFTLKDDTQDGIMIALAIPLDIAEKIALEPKALPAGAEGIPADNLHVTLTYLGTIQEADFTARDLMPVLSMFAMRQAPIDGVLNGYGKFVTSHKDGLQVCYLNFDSPQLPDLHHELLEALEEIGLEFEVNHGFTPHVTLAYVPEGKEVKRLPALPVNVSFDRIVLAFGDNWYEFYLSGSQEADKEVENKPGMVSPAIFPDNPPVPAVYSVKELIIDQVLALSTEKGNPYHAEDGKFTSGTGGSGGGGAISKKLPGNVKVIEGKKPPAKTKIGRVAVTGSGVHEIKGQKIGFYSGKVNGKRAFTFDEGKTWDTNKLNALVSAMGGFEAAEPFLRWSPTQKESLLSRILSSLTGLFVKKPVLTNSGPAFMTIKEKSGAYRWVSFSSNPYLDRDRQMVSLKALQADVARADATGEYGPLLWWHTGAKLGDCDYNAMIGKILVESGTFINPEIGAAVSQKADKLQVSIGMLHPLTDPDPNGVFHNIKRYERSILPAGRASNPLTAFVVKEKNLMSTLDTQKEAQLIALLGADLANAVINQAGRVEKQASDLGFSFAEKAAPADEEEEMGEEETEEEEMPPMPKGKKTKAAATLADMPADQFAALISGAVTSSVKEALTPLVASLTAANQTQTQKDAAQAQKQEDQVKALKELGEKVAKQEQALEATKKELTAQLAGLTGDLPPALAALAGYRPSQAQTNLTEKEKIPNQPAPDPMGDFMKFAAPYVNGQ